MLASPAMKLQAEQARLRTIALLIIATAATGFIFKVLAGAFVPLVIAVVVTFIAVPLIDWLQVRARLPRMVAVLVAFLVVMVGLGAVVAIIVSSLSGIDQLVDQYRDRVVSFTLETSVWAEQHNLPVDLDTVGEDLRNLPVLSWVHAFLGGAAGLLGNLVLVLIFTLFLISSRTPETRLTGTLGEVERSVRTYMVTKIGTSAATGLVTWVILILFGLDMAVFFALMTFILNFVPTIGSIVAVILPVPVALLQFGLGSTLVLVGLLIVVQQFIGNYIDPKLMGKGLNLHPVTILFALLVWGAIWGLIGMLFAAPLTAVVRIVLERYETTRPVAQLMAGKIAQPVEAG